MSENPSADWIEDCLHWRGKVLDGERAHWCSDWGELPVDDSCAEALCCSCFTRTEEELAAIREHHPETNPNEDAPF